MNYYFVCNEDVVDQILITLNDLTVICPCLENKLNLMIGLVLLFLSHNCA